MSVKRPFPADRHRTAIAIAYRNATLIADQVLPRVPVGGERFTWLEFDPAEPLTLPETTVGRTSQPTRVEFSAAEREGRTQDRGLEVPVPQSDIDEAPPGHSPLDQATEYAADIIELDREVRTAARVFDPDRYDGHHKEALSDGDRWSDPDAKPRDQLMDVLDRPLVRPNVLLMGQAAWTALRQHPQLVRSVRGTDGGDGVLTRRQLAELLEIDEILVGQGWVNIARPGAAPELHRVWQTHALLFHRNRVAGPRQGVTFGYTAQRGSRIAGDYEDRNIGLHGGRVVRVGEQVEEIIAAPGAAYLFQDVVAEAS